VKRDKATAKLVKDRDALLAFYDFPAEHWKHVRTSNPIESTFATVRHRPAPDEAHQGVPEPQDRARHGLQADDVGAGPVAQTRRPEPPPGGHQRG
jgi:hypothetical protein